MSVLCLHGFFEQGELIYVRGKMVVLSEGRRVMRSKVGHHCILRQVIIWLSTIWVEWTLHTCRVTFLYRLHFQENGNEIVCVGGNLFPQMKVLRSMIDRTRPDEVMQT